MNDKRYTERKIISCLREHFMTPNGARFQIEKLFVYNRWESDYLHITKSGYAYECEVKISRSDFFNDKKKIDKHQILEGTYKLHGWEKEQPPKPNYFYYAVPKDLVNVSEIPDYAGLIYIDLDEWPYVKIVKQAPKLHSDKFDEEKMKLIDKFYYNYLDWKGKAEVGYQSKIDSLKDEVKQLLKEAKSDEEGNKYKYTLKEAHTQIDILTISLRKSMEEQDRLNKTIDHYIKKNRRLHRKLNEFGLNWLEIQQIEEGETNGK